MPSLTAGERLALQNLSMKKAGKQVDWITIADARALTELGLAERNRSGWQITAEGEALLAGDHGDAEVTTLNAPAPPADQTP